MDLISEFFVGDEVCRVADPHARGKVVEGPRLVADLAEYKVKWSRDGNESWVQGTHIKLVESALDWTFFEGFMADLALQKFSHNFSDVMFSIGSSRTQFMPYQFKPVLQFLQQNPHGLLIADEVGLGKTIEAALITRELLARGSIERILVICPASLREKWRQELRNRFDIELRNLRARDFESFAETYRREQYWPPFFGVVSLEGLRGTSFEKTIEETGVEFDLVIIDEAHHMRNPGTRSFRLGSMLSDQSNHIILLSATPVQTGASDLLSLLRLVEPTEFTKTSQDMLNIRLDPNRYINSALRLLSTLAPNLSEIASEMKKALKTTHGQGFSNDRIYASWVHRLENSDSLTTEEIVRLRQDLQNIHTLAPYYTRTRKREVQDIAERVNYTYRVTLTPEELEFYEAWNTFIRIEASLRGISPGFYVVQPERQAASSIAAIREKVEGRIANAMKQEWPEKDEEHEGNSPDLEEIVEILSNISGKPDISLDQAIQRLRQAADNLPDQDSKLEEFTTSIQKLIDMKPGRKIICFTEWRGTLRRLSLRLQQEGIPCTTISGEVSPSERALRIDSFRQSDKGGVLLSTEVGSEGLDFEFCDAVVNYDLPWNPMRVEQRIGRIDRFGQQEKQVIVASFFVEDTIDTRVLSRLYDRIRVFEEAIGQLESILGPEIRSLQADILGMDMSPAAQEQRTMEAIQRIELEKQTLERIEDMQAELMGQGDLLRQEVDDIHDSGRYITSVEVKAILERWLALDQDSRNWMKTTRRDGIFDLNMSPDKVREIHQWRRKQRNHSREDNTLMERLSQRNAWVTFRNDKAQEFPNLPFLHIGHPIIGTAIDHLRADGFSPWKARVGRMPLPESVYASDPRSADGVALAIYRVELHGLVDLVDRDKNTQTTMLPIAISLSTGDVIEGIADQLLGSLIDGSDHPVPDHINEDDIDLMEEYSFMAASDRAREIETLTREQQESRIAVRAATFTRSYTARIARSLERAELASHDGIRLLHEGRARNLQADLDKKLNALRNAPEPTAERELISMVVFFPPGK